MQVVRSLIFDLIIYSWMAIMGIACSPLALASRDWTYRIMKAYSRHVVWLAKVILGLRFEEFRGTPPTGEVLICAKHESIIDMMLMMIAVPRPKYIMKKELKWAPILGFYAMRIGATAIDRKAKSKAVSQMTQGLDKARAEAGQIVIYPQGTRVAPGVDAPYKFGSAKLYERYGLPCVPAATNTGVFWGRKAWLKKPGLAVLEFLEPIEPGLPAADFMKIMSERVESESIRLAAEGRLTHSA